MFLVTLSSLIGKDTLTFFFSFLSSGQLYGLEKFWAFLKYSKAKTMEIDPKLQEYLHKFKRLEDFRIDVSKCFYVVFNR